MTTISAHDEEPAGADGVVYRALSADAPFAFVRVGAGGPRYDVVHQDGAPDTDGGVVAIELYAVRPGDDERFLAAWRSGRDELTARQGYLATRLYRAAEEAEHRFVELARWSSPLMVQRAGLERPALYLATRRPRP